MVRVLHHNTTHNPHVMRKRTDKSAGFFNIPTRINRLSFTSAKENRTIGEERCSILIYICGDVHLTAREDILIFMTRDALCAAFSRSDKC